MNLFPYILNEDSRDGQVREDLADVFGIFDEVEGFRVARYDD